MSSSPVLSLFGAEERARHARAVATTAARDRMAATVITDAAIQGNPAASAFVDEGAALLQRARVQRARARRLRSASARAAAMGYDRLASLGADVASAEDAAADGCEMAVVSAVRNSHASFGYVAKDEARILKNKDFLSSATATQTEAAFSNMLDRLAKSSTNFGRDDQEEQEDDVARRLGAALAVYKGDFPVVFGYDAYARLGALFEASTAVLKKRLANKKKILSKRSEKLEELEEEGRSGLQVQILRGQVRSLERTIARIQEKLRQRGALKEAATESKAEAVETEAAESAAVESESASPGSEVAPMSEQERRLLANQAALSQMSAGQADAAFQRIADSALQARYGQDLKRAGRAALALHRVGGPPAVRALRAGDLPAARRILARGQLRLAPKIGKKAAATLAGEAAVSLGLVPTFSGEAPVRIGDAVDILMSGGPNLAKAAATGHLRQARRAILRHKIRQVVKKAKLARATLGSESGTMFAGLPAVAVHGKSRPVFLGYFARRASVLGADDETFGGEDDDAFGGFFESIGAWFRKLFYGVKVESQKTERGLAARAAARAQFAPQLAERRQALAQLREARLHDVKEARKKYAPGLAESRKDLAHLIKDQNQAGAKAWKEGRDGMTPVSKLPKGASAEAEAEMPSEMRVVTGKGGWVYEQRADNSVRILDAPAGHKKAIDRVLGPGSKLNDAIVAEIGPFSEDGSATVGGLPEDDDDLLGDDAVVENEAGIQFQWLEDGSVQVISAPTPFSKWSGKTFPADSAVANSLRSTSAKRKVASVSEDLPDDDDDLLGDEASGPLESAVRATPQERTTLLARQLDKLLQSGAATYRAKQGAKVVRETASRIAKRRPVATESEDIPDSDDDLQESA